MLTTILGLHPMTGKIWRFHWDGHTMWPFTEEEMRVEEEAWQERREKLYADVMNAPQEVTQ